MKPIPSPKEQREMWQRAITLLMEQRKPLNAEQVKHSDRQERYGAE